MNYILIRVTVNTSTFLGSYQLTKTLARTKRMSQSILQMKDIGHADVDWYIDYSIPACVSIDSDTYSLETKPYFFINSHLIIVNIRGNVFDRKGIYIVCFMVTLST